MSVSSWQSMVNSLRMRLQSEATLDGAVVNMLADEIVARPFGNLGVQENLDALSAAARTGEPLPHLVPSDHTDAQLRGFLTRLVQRLEDLRPWPVPPYRAMPLPETVDLSALAPIARLSEHQLTVQNHIGELFRDREVDGVARGVLLLELGTGAVVTLLGPADLREAQVLLLAGQECEPGETITGFQAATKFPEDQIEPAGLPG